MSTNHHYITDRLSSHTKTRFSSKNSLGTHLEMIKEDEAAFFKLRAKEISLMKKIEEFKQQPSLLAHLMSDSGLLFVAIAVLTFFSSKLPIVVAVFAFFPSKFSEVAILACLLTGVSSIGLSYLQPPKPMSEQVENEYHQTMRELQQVRKQMKNILERSNQLIILMHKEYESSKSIRSRDVIDESLVTEASDKEMLSVPAYIPSNVPQKPLDPSAEVIIEYGKSGSPSL